MFEVMVNIVFEVDWVIGLLLKENVDVLLLLLLFKVKMFVFNCFDMMLVLLLLLVDELQDEFQLLLFGVQIFYVLVFEDEVWQLVNQVFE